MQTIKRSWLESWTNIAIGFLVNFLANLLILPAFGFASLTLEKNLALGVVYTGISLLRSFGIRRYFNRSDDNAQPLP